MNFIKDFISGIFLPLRALIMLLSHPTLALLCLVPIIVAAIGYVLIWDAALLPLRDSALVWSKEFIAGVFGADSLATLQSWLQTILGFLITLLFIVCTAFTFGWLSNLVALPVNDFIAEYSEKFTTPVIALNESFELQRFLRNLGIDLKKAVISGVVLVICFFVSWVPILNLGALLTAWLMITFAFVSYPQTRRGIGVRAGMKFVLRNFPMSIGFGLVLSMAFAIPFVSFAFLPLALIGGTIMYAERSEIQHNTQTSSF